MTHQSVPVLSADALHVAFADGTDPAQPSRTVVDGIGFTLHAGRVRALVGESGSGKSVTAMSALGLLPRTARVTGSFRLEGRELIGAPARVLREVRGGRVGTIFQEPMSAFDPVYTIGWQIAEAIRAHTATPRRQTRDRVAQLLSSAGIRDVHRVAASHPHELSGGQLQRAMIAMAISCDPVVLIADEPTTALDVTVQAGILELLRSLRDERGVGVLLITHDMGVVADLADDVTVMRAGHIVEEAEVHALFDAPRADYTRDLLNAVPRLDARPTEAAATGASPAPADTAVHPADAGESVHPVDAGESLVVRVQDVSIDYANVGRRRTVVHAVGDASFTIERGRTLGLVGESGSGKSTLGRALAGLVAVSRGSVHVAGVDLATASPRTLRRVRRGIGYVFQDPASSINPRSTVGSAIAEPLRLHTDLDRAARRRRVAELLDAVRLPGEFAGRYPHELSGGQRQRVALARAVALHPQLLIADEPTSALDVSVQAQVLHLLAQLQADLGFACLFISHDLAVVREVAHEVAVMDAGRIVESGETAALLEHPEHGYTRRLIAAAPVADPELQRHRRRRWAELAAEAEGQPA